MAPAFPHVEFDNVRPVLVPVADGPDASEVVGAAAEVCAGLGARAILLEVVPSPDGMERRMCVCGKTVDAVLRDEVCAHLRTLADMLHDAGVRVQLSVREGEPAATIVAEATASGVQMIVMGPHGPAMEGRKLVEEVAGAASVPVLVVGGPGGANGADPQDEGAGFR